MSNSRPLAATYTIEATFEHCRVIRCDDPNRYALLGSNAPAYFVELVDPVELVPVEVAVADALEWIIAHRLAFGTACGAVVVRLGDDVEDGFGPDRILLCPLDCDGVCCGGEPDDVSM